MRVFVVVLFLNTFLWAQNPDLMLTPNQRDSILLEYDQIFPFFGKKVVEKGIDVPNPVGINLLYLYATQPVEISNVKLGASNVPYQEVDFLQFPHTQSSVNTLNARLDLWVLPVLNIYGLMGHAWANTSVDVVIPGDTSSLQFTSVVDQTGLYWGGGFTVAMGIKKTFFSLDCNWAWTKLNNLDEPVMAGITGIRVGRTLHVGGTKRLALWGGTMNQRLKSTTHGTMALSEALPDLGGTLESDAYKDNDWYLDLSAPEQAIFDRFADEVDTLYEESIIEYGMNKALASPWNLLIGANLDLNKRWSVRAEAGLIGRYSFLGSAVYRFKI